MPESEDKERSEDRSSNRGAERFLPSMQVIGWAFVLLILVGYFAWMIVEMGGHAVTGGWPMLGVIVAAIAGGVAATLGMLVGRRGSRED